MARVVARDGRVGLADALRRAGVVRFALLIGCLGIVAWYVSLALRVDGNNDNDAAYYLGVARHMARTGRFEENIVWHFLGRPDSVIHPPFNYWQGLTSLVLVPVLVLFRGPHAPFVFMALVSGTALLLLWYLVTTAAPLAHPLAQAVTLLALGFSPAMTTYRVDTDTVPFTQLWIVASLLALAKGRLKTAACIAFLMVWTRGDGVVLCGLMWATCLWFGRKAPSPVRSAVPLLLTFAVLGAVHVTACMLLHGRVPSQAMWQAPRLTNYMDLYAFGHTPKLVTWVQRCRLKGIGEAFWAAIGNLQTTSFAPAHNVWLALVLLVGWRSVRWRLIGVVWALLFLGSSAIVFLSGPMFSVWRTLYPMLPLTALASGAMLDAILERLGRTASVVWGRTFGPPVAEVATGVALLFALVSAIRPLPLPPHELAGWDKNLRALAPALQGETVASGRPWSVIANTESPAVMIPDNGPEAVEEALKAYRVKWLLLSREPCAGSTEEICAKIRDGSVDRLGTLQLIEHPGADDLRLFRIEERGEEGG